MSLLSEIQAAAIDSKTPVSDLLRRCLVLAARLKHEELASWASKELQGYTMEDALPPYRMQRRGQSRGDFLGPGNGLKNVPIPTAGLPEEVRTIVTERPVRESVSVLEANLHDDGNSKIPWPADIIKAIGRQIMQHMVLVDAWTPVPIGQTHGILDTIRTRVLEFVLAIEKVDPTAGETPPNAPSPPVPLPTVSQVFNTYVLGGLANFGNSGTSSVGDGNIASAGNAQTIGERDKAQIADLVAELKAKTSELPPDDQDEAAAHVRSIETQLAKPAADLARIQRNLSSLVTLATAVAPTARGLATMLGLESLG
jgi:hypothetical protein